MDKVVIVSHGNLAIGLKDSLEMIIGQNKQVFALSMGRDENPDQIAADFKKIYEEYNNNEDNFLIASDIPGGSVNSVMMNFLEKENVYLVSGINLVFLLEFLMSNEKTIQKAIDNAILVSKEALKEINIEIQDNEENFWE